MSWLKQNWVYIVSFILGGVAGYSDLLLIILAFGGWTLVLGLLIVIFLYWIKRFFELIRYGKCNHNIKVKRLTICLLLFLLIGPVLTTFIATNILKFYGNHLIEKVEKHKEDEGAYPMGLYTINPIPLTIKIYRYSEDNENETFYLSFKSRAMVRKYYDYESKKWFQSSR